MPSNLRTRLALLRHALPPQREPVLQPERVGGSTSVATRMRDALRRSGWPGGPGGPGVLGTSGTLQARVPGIASLADRDVPMIDDAQQRHSGWCTRVSKYPLAELTGFHPALSAPGRLESDALRHGRLLGMRERPSGGSARIVFLDLETTGLRGSGTMAWCVGLASLEIHAGQASARVEQVLLETPDAEGAAFSLALSRIEAADILVTFNGRSFDLPLLESRCVLQRRQPPPRRADIDLLPPARRLLASGDATLIGVERRLGRTRVDDIAGADVPRAWFDWLRQRDTLMLRRAIDHNRDDLLSMVAILSWLLALAADAPDARALTSSVGHAELLASQGDGAGALRRLADGPHPGTSTEARRRARLLHSLAGRAAARPDWARLVAEGDSSSEPWEGMAKILEHDERALSAAAGLVREALGHVTSQSGRIRLRHRLTRLERRLAQHDARVPLATVPPESPGLVDCPRFPESTWKSSHSDIRCARSPKSARS